ncbi:hypothetical protein C8R45DRAFT_994239 [Mycena sanguinolenta]|nr:hypothetical protein C8R45DRAFT_994239 [Mycena sanguinolenta]
MSSRSGWFEHRQSSSMQFQELPEDVLRTVLSLCDIYAVVCVSGTNKYFYHLCTEKSVWVDLVDNLRRRGFVDRLSLSDIQSCSQEGLVGLVKGLLAGPLNWNKAESELPILVQTPTKYTIHPRITPTNATFLGGGEHILCYSVNTQTLECWSVRYDKLVWAYVKKKPPSKVREFDAEVINGGANIIVCEMDESGPTSQLEIVNLDFATGTSTSLLVCQCPLGSCFIRPKICGDIVFVGFQAGSSITSRLINWKTQVHLELASSKTLPAWQFVVIPIRNYTFVLCTPFSNSKTEITILCNSALSSHWRDMAAHPTPDIVYFADLEFILHQKIAFPNEPLSDHWWTHALHAYESPLEEGTYRIWFVIITNEAWGLLLCSFHLSLPKPGNNRITWRPRTSPVPLADTLHEPAGISFSGYTVHHFPDSTHSVIAPSGMAELNLNEDDPERRSYTHISTYSEALTSVDVDGTVVISYI